MEDQLKENTKIKKTPSYKKAEQRGKNYTSGTKTKKDSRCPVSGRCGGCQFIDISYKKQLEEKKRVTAQLLKPFCRLEGICGMENPEHYRNKVSAAFSYDRKGNPFSGVYAANSHDVISVETCLIEDEKADEIIGTIRGMLKSFKIKVYNEDTGYGLLRHVLVRVGKTSGQIMVVLVSASPVFPSKNNFVKALLAKHPEITTIVLNVNDKRTSMVLGEKEHVLYGKGFIEDELCGKVFKISPKSFYQVNPVQTQILYKKSIEYAGLSGKETVIDAYCGIGTIGIIASDKAKKVVSVELNQDAVKDAVFNAKRNQVKNIDFYHNDAGRFMTQMAEQGEHADVVFLDPPRAGSDEAFLSSVAALAPERVVYISCNPETLARDLKFLTKKGYQAEKAEAVDMFPFTEEVETVVKLSLKKDTPKIEVTMEPGAESNYTPADKATYQKIKAYVQEKHGLNVSNLYIAQIKDKCGIDKRENYNLPKSEDAKVPKCPPEKEAAIMDAFRHFNMI